MLILNISIYTRWNSENPSTLHTNCTQDAYVGDRGEVGFIMHAVKGKQPILSSVWEDFPLIVEFLTSKRMYFPVVL